jgi:hypothetical protein
MDLMTKVNNDADLARIPLTGNKIHLSRESLPLTSAAKATAIATAVAVGSVGAGFGVGYAVK